MKNKVIRKPKTKVATYKGLFFVIKFINTERSDKLFECLPDIWYVNEDRDACYWPPRTGKSFTLRSISGEMPDETYTIHQCEVIYENLGKLKLVN